MTIARIKVLPEHQQRVGIDHFDISCHDTDVSVLPSMLKYGSYEPHIQALLCNIIKPNSVVADVGANYGQHTVLLSYLVGEKGAVSAIEASKENYEHLLTTIRGSGKYVNVCCTNCGVWDKEELLTFHHSDAGAACDFFTTNNHAPENPSYQIQTITLDNLLKDIKLDFMLIDIEGGELHALKGATKTLAHNPPLLIELNNYCCKAFCNIDILEVIAYIMDTLGYTTIAVYSGQHNNWMYVHRESLEQAFKDGAVIIDTLFTLEN